MRKSNRQVIIEILTAVITCVLTYVVFIVLVAIVRFIYDVITVIFAIVRFIYSTFLEVAYWIYELKETTEEKEKFRRVYPLRLRLDAAIPDKAELGRAFVLATSVRQIPSPVLAEDDLNVVKSGNVQAWWPKFKSSTKLKIQINAPDCKIHGKTSHSFRLYKEEDSPIFNFHLTPKKAGVISVIVLVYQKAKCVGSTQVYTVGYEQVVGSVQLEVISREFHPERSTRVEDDNEKASIESQITYLTRRRQRLLDIEAKKGIDTEPHYIIEREDLDTKLEELKIKRSEIARKSR